MILWSTVGVQIAKAMGASPVIGICSEKNRGLVKSLGADRVIAYDSPSFESELDSLKGSVSLVYDTVTSFDPRDPNYEPLLRPLLHPIAGRYVAINAMPSDWIRALLSQIPGLPNLQRDRYDLVLVQPDSDMLIQAAKWAEAKKLRVSTTEVRSVEEAVEGLKSRRHVGKYVIKLG